MTERQLSIDFEARAAGDAAAQACASTAARVSAFVVDEAKRFVLGHLARHGQQPGELIVDAAVAHGIRPHDTRAFGVVFKTLARAGLIRCMGFCERQKGHGTAGGRVWGLAR